MAIPGLRMLAFAVRWFDAATVSRVFEPLIADWQREWVDAAPRNRAWVRVRGTLAFIAAAIAISPRAILLAPTAPAVARRVLSRLIIYSSVTSLPLLLPFLMEMRIMPPLVIATLVWWLLPSVVVMAFPFVIIVVADAVRRHQTPSRDERVQTLRFGIAAVVLMFVVHGWIVPATNQQYRVGMADREYFTAMSLDTTGHPPRGIRELTTYELIVEKAEATASEHPFARTNMLSRELHTRVSFTVLACVLLWLRWLAIGGSTPRWRKPLPALIWIVGLFVAYYAMRLTVDHVLDFGPAAGAWFPVLSFWAAGMSALRVRRRIPA